MAFDRKSLAQWARETGIAASTAKDWHSKRRVGVLVSGAWLLTKSEWNMVMKQAVYEKTRNQVKGN
jgi:hypothetical protein